MAHEDELTPEETDLLTDAKEDDVSFAWALIDLGIRSNPPQTPDWRPSDEDIDAAFAIFAKLSNRDLISVGRIEYIDGGPPGRVAPVRHIPEALDAVRARVEAAVSAAKVSIDWEFSCWIVATDATTACSPDGDSEPELDYSKRRRFSLRGHRGQRTR
jgi:hypothetical protein